MILPHQGPIDELIRVLVQQTQAGQIRWEKADGFGSTFIAKRPSGTVVLRSGLGSSVLEVKNRRGETIDQTAGGLGALLGGASNQLNYLAELVRRQEEEGRLLVKKLANEFKTPDS